MLIWRLCRPRHPDAALEARVHLPAYDPLVYIMQKIEVPGDLAVKIENRVARAASFDHARTNFVGQAFCGAAWPVALEVPLLAANGNGTCR